VLFRSEQLAAPDLEIDAVDSDDGAEAFGETFDPDDRIGRQFPTTQFICLS
jgi:hypothetical protein